MSVNILFLVSVFLALELLSNKMLTGMELIAISGKIIDICYNLTLYFQKIQNVDSTLAVFGKEIKDFSAVLSNIQNTVTQLGESGFVARTGRRHWEDIGISLSDLKELLETLDRLALPERKTLLPTILRRTKDQIHLDWNAHNIDLLRRQISSCRQMLMISLSMVTVYLFLDPRLSDNSTSLDRQETRMAEMRSILEIVNNNIQQLLVNDTIRPGLDSSFLKHLQRGVHSAESWVANASSSAAGCGMTTPKRAPGETGMRRTRGGSRFESENDGIASFTIKLTPLI
jgi:hypothetical protein